MSDQLLAECPRDDRAMSEEAGRDVRENVRRGTRPPGKRTCRVEFWTTPEQLAALNRLNGIGAMIRSDHLRRAAEMYLEYIERQGAKHA